MKKSYFIGILLFVFSFNITDVSAATIANNEINLYHLSNKYSHLEMPSNYKEEEKIIVSDATGNVTYRMIEGEYTSVTADGVVKMEPQIWWCKSYCQSWEPEDKTGYTKRVDYHTEDAKVEVSIGKEKFIVNVYTHLYENEYAENKMKDYVNKNISSSMTEMEKMKKIMQFISMTKYSPYSSSYVGLIAGDGADCWGDTSAILYMADLVGIKAHARNANRDSGAGSGHRNVAAVLDETVYIVDVMSTSTTPRVTEIVATRNGFSVNGFGEVIQYDGYDKVAFVPESQYITKIGNLAMYYGQHTESIVKEVHIPKTITSIGIAAFSATSTVEKVIVDSKNPNYKNIGNNLYSKDGSILYSYPAGQKEETFIVPKEVKSIENTAFYGAKNLKNIEFPSGLQTIGEVVFLRTSIKEATIPASVTTIGSGAFSNTELTIKNKNAVLGEELCNSYTPIHGYKGSTTEEYAIKNNCEFIEIPKGEYLLGDLNDDGIIKMSDVILALRFSLEIENPNDDQLLRGDIDADGSIKMNDVIFILKESLNLNA